MIADLRGAVVLLAESDPGLRSAIQAAFERQGAACLDFDLADFRQTLAAAGRADILIVGRHAGAASGGIEDFTDANMIAALTGGAWRVFDVMRQIRDALGVYPRYVIGLSTPAPDHLAPGEDLRAASDAAMETLCRYASYRLLEEDVRVNVIRYRLPASDFVKQHTPPLRVATAEDIANAAVALCSGLMDSVRGQVLTVDRGATFHDCLMSLYDESEAIRSEEARRHADV